jgi:hypothetical protein
MKGRSIWKHRLTSSDLKFNILKTDAKLAQIVEIFGPEVYLRNFITGSNPLKAQLSTNLPNNCIINLTDRYA